MISSNLKVLLVEDEFIISMLTEDMLNELGFEVSHTASTLEEGLKCARGGGFDVAVLDINLNGVMSYPIADLLAERAVPFLFASGYAAQGIDPRCPGVSKLQKPFTMASLNQVMAHTLRRSDPQC